MDLRVRGTVRPRTERQHPLDNRRSKAGQADLSEILIEEAEPKHVQSGNVFGQFLNMARRERGLSVQQLAQTIGMNPYDLLLLEVGKELPRAQDSIEGRERVPVFHARKLAQAAGLMIA